MHFLPRAGRLQLAQPPDRSTPKTTPPPLSGGRPTITSINTNIRNSSCGPQDRILTGGPGSGYHFPARYSHAPLSALSRVAETIALRRREVRIRCVDTIIKGVPVVFSWPTACRASAEQQLEFGAVWRAGVGLGVRGRDLRGCREWWDCSCCAHTRGGLPATSPPALRGSRVVIYCRVVGMAERASCCFGGLSCCVAKWYGGSAS